MKRIASLLLCLVLFALLPSGCAPRTQEREREAEPSPVTLIVAQPPAVLECGQLDDCYIEIAYTEVKRDRAGRDMLEIVFNYTNTSGEALSFLKAADVRVYQGDVELTQQGNYSDEFVENAARAAKSGVTLEVARTFLLNDAESEIEIQIHNEPLNPEEEAGPAAEAGEPAFFAVVEIA